MDKLRKPLPRDFYDRDPRAVSRDLLGKVLVRRQGQELLRCPHRRGRSLPRPRRSRGPLRLLDAPRATQSCSAHPVTPTCISSTATTTVSTCPAFQMDRREASCSARWSHCSGSKKWPVCGMSP